MAADSVGAVSTGVDLVVEGFTEEDLVAVALVAGLVAVAMGAGLVAVVMGAGTAEHERRTGIADEWSAQAQSGGSESNPQLGQGGGPERAEPRPPRRGGPTKVQAGRLGEAALPSGEVLNQSHC